MAGGCLCCLRCFFTITSVLLVWVCLHGTHYVEASSRPSVINKKVGDTVELSSCLPTEGVDVAKWNYGSLKIADKDATDYGEQFKDRLDFNPTNYSLTVRQLTLRDSGDFKFLSEVNGQQRGTVTITLQVHEPITKPPALTYNSTWHASNESCTVLLECGATSDSHVTYEWTVRNQTIPGSTLQYITRKQDEDTTFTCTIRNVVSEMSASKTVKCSNETSEESSGESKLDFFILLGAGVGGCVIIVIIVGIVASVCNSKQHRAGSDSNDLTVYADITEVTMDNEITPNMKPCSVYETIENRVDPVRPAPQTVYDKIQLSRVRKASVSPYQEIS